MDIVVRGKNVDVPPRLHKLAREKVRKISKFTHDAGRVEVEFSELRNRRVSDNQVCDVIVHLKRNFVKAHAAASEPAAALDLALDKVEHQLARIKEKRVTRTHAPRRNRVASGDADVLPAPAGNVEVDEDDDEDGILNRIVKTKRLTMKPMGPEEAALQMDLLGHDFFLFTNAENYIVKTSSTMTMGGQARSSQNTITAKWLGADCGDVKPFVPECFHVCSAVVCVCETDLYCV